MTVRTMICLSTTCMSLSAKVLAATSTDVLLPERAPVLLPLAVLLCFLLCLLSGQVLHMLLRMSRMRRMLTGHRFGLENCWLADLKIFGGISSPFGVSLSTYATWRYGF